jgi:hypothetical protein
MAVSRMSSNNAACVLHPHVLSSDSVASRALPNQTIPESVTVESCTSACKAKDFAVAGLEFGLECCEFRNPLNIR